MKKWLTLVIMFAGCSGPTGMSLDEQVAAVKKCKEAGGRVEEVRYAGGGACAKVNCYFGPSSSDYRQEQGKPCVDKGGIPIYSIWDGRLKDCKFPPVEGK